MNKLRLIKFKILQRNKKTKFLDFKESIINSLPDFNTLPEICKLEELHRRKEKKGNLPNGKKMKLRSKKSFCN